MGELRVAATGQGIKEWGGFIEAKPAESRYGGA
jgi:hypothetical protein